MSKEEEKEEDSSGRNKCVCVWGGGEGGREHRPASL